MPNTAVFFEAMIETPYRCNVAWWLVSLLFDSQLIDDFTLGGCAFSVALDLLFFVIRFDRPFERDRTACTMILTLCVCAAELLQAGMLPNHTFGVSTRTEYINFFT